MSMFKCIDIPYMKLWEGCICVHNLILNRISLQLLATSVLHTCVLVFYTILYMVMNKGWYFVTDMNLYWYFLCIWHCKTIHSTNICVWLNIGEFRVSVQARLEDIWISSYFLFEAPLFYLVVFVIIMFFCNIWDGYIVGITQMLYYRYNPFFQRWVIRPP